MLIKHQRTVQNHAQDFKFISRGYCAASDSLWKLWDAQTLSGPDVPYITSDCRLFQLDDEQMCGFSLTTASRSSSFDTVDRLLTGRKFSTTETGDDGKLHRSWKQAGRKGSIFARSVMMTESSVWQWFRSWTGTVSSGEVISGNFWISHSTSLNWHEARHQWWWWQQGTGHRVSSRE